MLALLLHLKSEYSKDSQERSKNEGYHSYVNSQHAPGVPTWHLAPVESAGSQVQLWKHCFKLVSNCLLFQWLWKEHSHLIFMELAHLNAEIYAQQQKYSKHMLKTNFF